MTFSKTPEFKGSPKNFDITADDTHELSWAVNGGVNGGVNEETTQEISQVQIDGRAR